MPTAVDSNSRTTIIPASAFAAQVFRRGGDLDGALRRRANKVARTARVLAPHRSYRLRQSIGVEQNRAVQGQFSFGYRIYADAPYAVFVHNGTRPHRITARRAKVLYSQRDGFLGVSVMHPGTKPNPFMTKALVLAARG